MIRVKLTSVLLVLLSCQQSNAFDILGAFLSPSSPPGQPAYCLSTASSTPSLAHCSSSTLNDLINARTVHGSEDRPDGLLPSWLNIPLAKRGQQVFNDYLAGTFFGAGFGLATLVYPDISDVLKFTGKSELRSESKLRYIATGAQVVVWYEDLFNGPPDSSTSDMIQSLHKVRSLHTSAAQAASIKIRDNGYLVDPDIYANYTLQTALSGPFYEDLEASNIPQSQRVLPPSNWANITSVPINQQAMALTQFAFVGFPVLFPERLGMDSASDDELWAFNHLWAILGYALGIDNKYNVALQPDLATQRQLYQQIFDTFSVPVLFHMDFSTKALAENVMLGLQDLAGVIPVTPNSVLYLFATQILQIQAPKTYGTLTAEEKVIVQTIITTYIPLLNSNPAFRTAENAGIYASAFQAGVQTYGTDYLTRYSRARDVFYARYN